jgi:outer membrane protein, heavy metal efflux system
MPRRIRVRVSYLAWCLLAAAQVLLGAGVHYRARPIDAAQQQAQFESRRLNDAGLRDYVRRHTAEEQANAWPPSRLALPSITAIAEYYSPDLATARAQVNAARAAVVTARERINPSFAGDGGYSNQPDAPATYSGALNFKIETAGKRGYRILGAQHRAAAAELSFSESDWQVRSHVRQGFVDYAFAVRRLQALQKERAVRASVEEIFEKRLSVGEAATPDLDLVRAARIAADVGLRQANGDVSQTEALLASAMGLPTAAFQTETIDTSGLDTPPEERSLPLAAVQKRGLLHRADVQRSLAEYAAADAALRLEIARQYPDIQLSPTYALQEGFAEYTLGIGLSSLPIFHHNQGPIAEAEAQREIVAAQFKVVQSQAVGQMEQSLRRYRAAYAEWRSADRDFVAVQRERQVSVEQAFAAGEVDRLALENARLLAIGATRVRDDALQRTQAALGSLEDAVQQSLETNGVTAPSAQERH